MHISFHFIVVYLAAVCLGFFLHFNSYLLSRCLLLPFPFPALMNAHCTPCTHCSVCVWLSFFCALSITRLFIMWLCSSLAPAARLFSCCLLCLLFRLYLAFFPACTGCCCCCPFVCLSISLSACPSVYLSVTGKLQGSEVAASNYNVTKCRQFP